MRGEVEVEGGMGRKETRQSRGRHADEAPIDLDRKNKVAVVEMTGVGPAEPQPSNVSHLEHRVQLHFTTTTNTSRDKYLCWP